MTIRTAIAGSLLLATVLSAACAPPDEGRPDFRLRTYLKVLEAEDSRHIAGDNLDVLLAGTRSADAFIRQVSVRALGRLETPSLLGHIEPLLSDDEAEVRADAANAMAQAVHRQDGTAALRPLLDHLSHEEVPGVRGTIARSLGRLRLSDEDRPRVARTLITLSRSTADEDAPRSQLVGAVLGMDSFVRGTPRGGTVDSALQNRLRELIGHGLMERPQTTTMARIRGMAVAALGNAGGLTVYDIEFALRDPGEQARQAAAARLSVLNPAARPEFIRRLIRDPSPQVRMEGIRAITRDPLDETACLRLLAVATQEMTTGVRTAALDALGRPCPDTERQVAILNLAASSRTGAAPDPAEEGDEPVFDDWHEASHALVSLARVAPLLAAPLVGRHAADDNPFVRAYATRAAAVLENPGVLRRMAGDPDANVRTLALQELVRLEGREADPLLIRGIRNNEDEQLLMTAAQALAGTDLRAEAADVALAALERLTEENRQTLRDPRVALLTLVGQVGSADLAPRITGYIRDSDPRIADLASAILQEWTGDRYIAAPRPARRLALPTEDEMEELLGTSVVFYMARGGAITIELHPYEATTTAFRFANMARDGVFDSLTLHRVVPNFVTQGGSPGANEFAGHGAFTRDEVGLPVQWRGTVGISTRGHDTGDGQIYFNLIDNVRLNHDYTVIGTVIGGMEVVDAIMEGDVIERAEVRRRQ